MELSVPREFGVQKLITIGEVWKGDKELRGNLLQREIWRAKGNRGRGDGGLGESTNLRDIHRLVGHLVGPSSDVQGTFVVACIDADFHRR